MTTITPNLWFNDNAEEAMNFWCSIFKDATITRINRGPDGKLFTGTIQLNNQTIHVINGGPHYALNPAFSLWVDCADQTEVDYYWNKLIEGGKESRCGWLVDPFGVSWQIIPKLLGQLFGHSDREKAGRAMQAMMKMNKIECQVLQDAFDGK